MTRPVASAARLLLSGGSELEVPGSPAEASGYSTGVDGVFFISFTVLIGLFVQVIWSESKLFKKYLPLPFTVVIFIVGLSWGYFTDSRADGHYLDSALNDISGIDPHLFLQLFIPPLLFESGWAMNTHMFRRSAWSCLWLASTGVVISMLVTAMLCYYIYPDDWNWNSCLIFGSIAAATDPVAVGAVLKELGAPETLATVIEGESLLNDGTAFVFFTLFLEMAKETKDAGHIASTLCQMAIGGAAFGAAMGGGVALCLKLNYLRNNLFFEIMFTLVMPYITFWVAENPLGLSGVLAVVIMSLVANKYGKLFVRHKHEVHVFWEHVSFICNSIVFMISGAGVGISLSQRGLHDVEYQLASYVYMNIIRFVIVFGSIPLLARLGYGFDCKQAAVATWGGLRGAVGLAMAVIVSHDENITEKTRTEIFDYTASLVLLTLCVNGTTTGPLLRYLGYNEKSDVGAATGQESRAKLILRGQKFISKTEDIPGLSSKPNVAVLERHLEKLDRLTKESFDSIPLVSRKEVPSDLNQVREQILQSVDSHLNVASDRAFLDSLSLSHLQATCHFMLDIRYSATDSETRLRDWWKVLLEPIATRKTKTLCPCLEKIPGIRKVYQAYEFQRSLLGIEIALAFQTIINQVVAKGLQERKESQIEREESNTSMQRATDIDGDGRIDRQEFLQKYGNDKEFDALDVNGSGFLTADDYKDVMSKDLSPDHMHDAMDLIKTALLQDLEAAVADSKAWLQQQCPELVAMLNTRRGVGHLFNSLESATGNLHDSGGLASHEAKLLLDCIHDLQIEHDWRSIGPHRFRKAFAAHDTHDSCTTESKNPVSNTEGSISLSMGQDPKVDLAPQAQTLKIASHVPEAL